MEFTSRRYADFVVAVLMGRVNHTNSPGLTEALAPLLEAPEDGVRGIVLDFAGVEYISSVGLRVLMIASRQARAQERTIAVAALQPVVGEIFEISRFKHIVDVFPTVRAALGQYSRPALAAYDGPGGPAGS